MQLSEVVPSSLSRSRILLCPLLSGQPVAFVHYCYYSIFATVSLILISPLFPSSQSNPIYLLLTTCTLLATASMFTLPRGRVYLACDICLITVPKLLAYRCFHILVICNGASLHTSHYSKTDQIDFHPSRTTKVPSYHISMQASSASKSMEAL